MILNPTYYELLTIQVQNDIISNNWCFTEIIDEFERMDLIENKRQWYDYNDWLNDTLLVFKNFLDKEISNNKVTKAQVSLYVHLNRLNLNKYY